MNQGKYAALLQEQKDALKAIIDESKDIKGLFLSVRSYIHYNDRLTNISPQGPDTMWSDVTIGVKAYNAVKYALMRIEDRLPADKRKFHNHRRTEYTLRDIAGVITLQDLKEQRNVGPKTIKEVKELFTEHGLTLSPS
jgi:hypothetical protein